MNNIKLVTLCVLGLTAPWLGAEPIGPGKLATAAEEQRLQDKYSAYRDLADVIGIIQRGNEHLQR